MPATTRSRWTVRGGESHVFGGQGDDTISPIDHRDYAAIGDGTELLGGKGADTIIVTPTTLLAR